ncbi:hypothetical protein [Thiorhodovibrio frisius]|uniref:hypothetical protein n=1 Tax=Thiorhodovibrio frisius TaxID=631362 RepID=UPI00167F7EEC|nr:hypothetical protein [Thiorhodovibrio frisius]
MPQVLLSLRSDNRPLSLYGRAARRRPDFFMNHRTLNYAWFFSFALAILGGYRFFALSGWSALV